MKTKERLVAALKEAQAPEHMITLAQAGAYDEFEGNHPTPITWLAFTLSNLGLDDLARCVRAGEFDATDEEAAAWVAAQSDPKILAALEKILGAKK